MQVIVKRAFGPYSVGHIIPDLSANQAEAWKARGLVRPMRIAEDDKPAFADRMLRAGPMNLPRITRRAKAAG